MFTPFKIEGISFMFPQYITPSKITPFIIHFSFEYSMLVIGVLYCILRSLANLFAMN